MVAPAQAKSSIDVQIVELSTYGRRSRLSDPKPCVLESPKHTTTGASGPAATFAFFAAGGIVTA